MKITYEGSTLDTILNDHKVNPISYIHLSEEEFDQIFDEAFKANVLEKFHGDWFTVKGCEIVFYLDRNL